jgi:hypothetical protein
MRKILSLIFILFITLNIKATNLVPEYMAKRVAINFYYESIQSFKKTSLSDIKITDTYIINENTIPVYYVFNISNQGHIYIAAYDNIHPVLGYSYEGIYKNEDEQSPAYNEFMQNYKEQIMYAQTNKIEASQEINDEWANYGKTDFIPSKSITAVSPLLTTIWDQGLGYNALCPGGSGCTHSYAGCVATAMAQVMKFHNYPTNGLSNHSYTDPPSTCDNNTEPSLGTVSADFANTTYGWSNMPDHLIDYNNDVATLIKHCGVSVNMNYGCCSSGAYNSSCPYALINYFKYYFSAKSINKSSYSTTDWQNLLVQELNSNRPIIYGGNNNLLGNLYEGHAFVCDGYDNSTYFHFNWGWSGSCNGYFYLDNLNPTINGTTHNFTYNQEAVIGIMPPKMNGPDLVCNGSTNNFNVIPVVGATYAWVIPAGFTIVPNDKTIDISDGVSPPTPVTPPSINILTPATGSGTKTISVTVTYGGNTQTISKTFALGIAQPTFNSMPDVNELERVTWTINPVPGAASYHWSVVPGEHGVAGAVVLSPSGTHCLIFANGNAVPYGQEWAEYIISVYASNSCGNSPIASEILGVYPYIHPNDMISGLNNLNKISTFSIYPNPNNNGLFNIAVVSNSSNDTKSNIFVYDVMGNVVYENTNMDLYNGKIDLSKKAKGIYFIKIINGNDTFIDKLIFQ